MAERSCCDDIIETMARAKSMEEWRDEYIISAQRWRDDHEHRNNVELERIMGKLENIENRLTTWVNPIIAIVISVLTGLLGILAGAVYMLAR